MGITLQTTNSFHKLYDAFSFQKVDSEIKQIICYEGGSRAAKSYSILELIIVYAQHYSNQGRTIRVFRAERSTCMVTIYQDFIDILKRLGIYNEQFHKLSSPTSYILYGNTIYFHGLDDKDKVHGMKQHISYFNEALEIDKETFQQVNKNTIDAVFCDWNPKCTDHFMFDLEKRDDVIFLHSTFIDNAFLPESIIKEIKAYEPTKENINKGTADEYMWKVYGLGLRSSPQGLVYPNITWIDAFPDNIEQIYYGLDFGYTNSPSAIIKLGRNGNNLYVQGMFYEPTDNANTLYEPLNIIIGGNFVAADSADPTMITDLRMKGMNVIAVKKFHNSVQYGIDLIKRFKVHAVRNHNLKKEFENYKWRELGGVILNEPVKEHDHYMDAMRYAAITNLRY